MARIRYIKPAFPEDEKLAPGVSRDARLFYILSWCWMDKQGLLENAPRVLKRNIFPYDEDITPATIEHLIDELKIVRRLFEIEWQGVKLIYCPTMRKHQKFHRDEGYKYKIPEEILAALVKSPEPPKPEGNSAAPTEPPASTIQAPSGHPTGTIQVGCEQPSSSLPAALVTGTGNGELGIGTGTGIGNGELATGNGELGTGNRNADIPPEILAAQAKLEAKRKAGGFNLPILGKFGFGT